MKKLKYIFFTVLIMVTSACNEQWLELNDPNRKSAAVFWKTEDEAFRAVNATYQSLYYDGTFLRFAPIALDLRGDDVWSPSPWDVLSNTGSFKLFNNTIMQEWLWVAFYGGVYRANQVLANIDKIQFKNDDFKNRLKGEALFLRGLYYFYLVNFFNNIPLVLKPFEQESDYYPTQEKPEVVWEKIYSDFDEASKLLPNAYTDPDVGRATKGAALGFLGKAYLFNKKYTEAAEKFKAVIDLGIYELAPNYQDNFSESKENNKESLFEIQFSREVGGTDIGWVDAPAATWGKATARAITYAPTPFGWGDVAPTKWIFNEFRKEKTVGNEDDLRLKASIYYDYPGAMMYGKSFQDAYATNLLGIFLKKYGNGDSGRPDEKDWRSGINERLMRYADILLMYAECQNELGNKALCAKYIQTIRDRVKLPNREAEFAAFNSDQLREQLSHERALEFFLEGHRFDDIRRWGWLQNEVKLNELVLHDKEFESYRAGREYFSLPQREVQINTKLKQNPGY